MPTIIEVLVGLVVAFMVCYIINYWLQIKRTSQETHPDQSQSSDKHVAINDYQLQSKNTDRTPFLTDDSTTTNCSSKMFESLKEELTTDSDVYLERKRRIIAEDWANFLAEELKAQMSACQAVEYKCRKLKRKISSSANLKDLSNDDMRLENCACSSRKLKDINEAFEVWQKSDRIRERNTEKNDTWKEDDDDDNEWLKIVTINETILNLNQQSTLNKSDIKQTYMEFNENQNVNKSNQSLTETIPAHDIRSNEEDKHKLFTEKVKKKEDNNNANKFEVSRVTEKRKQSKKNDDRKRRKDENAFVCTDSVKDVNETRKLWENFSSSSTSTPTTTMTNDKESLTEDFLLLNLSKGLVKKTTRLWEQSGAQSSVLTEDHAQ